MKKWLFNPFIYVAGTKSLLIGAGVIILTAVIAIFSQTHFDGPIDMHMGADLSIPAAFVEPLIDWICLVLPLYLLGRIASGSSIRFIDVAGTEALARWPMFIVALLGFIRPPDKVTSADDALKLITQPSFIIQSLAVLPFIVLTVALMYNAFSVSTNLKGGKGAGIFIAGLVIAEILSKVILMTIIK